MTKKVLLIVLVFSMTLELALTAAAFFFRETTLEQFGVSMNSSTNFLGMLIAWFLLFVSLICGYASWQVWKTEYYSTLCYLLGAWWIAIGLGIYLSSGRPDNLVLDSLKGLIIVLLTWRSKHK